MQKLVREYLNELNKRQKKNRKVRIAVMLLAVIVAGSVMGILTQYGVAMTGAPKCGLEEHKHDDSCYEKVAGCLQEWGQEHTHTDACRPEKELTCGQEESAGHAHTDACRPEKELTCGQDGEEGHEHAESCYTVPEGFVCGMEESEGHSHTEECYTVPEGFICGMEELKEHEHTEECYTEELTCKTEEHEHTDICYTDAAADVEDPASWDAQYAAVEWKGLWGEDLAEAARMQIGIRESANNFTVAENGVHKGYSRYGHFAGDMYRDWDAAFVNFCLHYAGVKASGLFPDELDSAKWQDEFHKIREENHAYLTGAAGYAPKAGDIIFFNKENEETSVQMGIVSGYDQMANVVFAIEGNSGNSVKENQYDAGDAHIVSYLKMSELEAAFKGSSPNHDSSVTSQEPQDPMELEADMVTAQEPQKTKKRVLRAAGNGDSLAGDDAYVNSIEITSIVDGVEPFDTNDDAGNDSNSSNRRVRTFDAVTYNFSVNMKPWNTSDSFKEARVKMEFVLPATKSEAVFDETAMAWMDQSEGYQPVITEETRKIDGVATECQVLTCYRHLIPAGDNLSVVPGDFGNNVTINVKAMRNGQTFAPIFSAAMEYGAWDGACENEEHKDQNGQPMLEKKTVTAEPITVTAAPKYNIYVKGDGSYKDTFDFSTGTDQAANKDKGQVTGRLMKIGIALQLYNDNASKGLKGIELPNGDAITFDLDLGSTFQINNPKPGSEYQPNTRVDTTDEYTPLLWGFDSSKNNGYGGSDKNGRVLNDYQWVNPYVPYDYAGGDKSAIHCCWNSGSWDAKQNGSKIQITVSGYEINPEHMPTKNGDWGDDIYGANVGCFSAGEIFVVQPYNKINSSSQEPYFDVVTGYGEGSFSTSVHASNLQATTMSGLKVQQGVDGFQQMKNDDDEETRTLELTLEGSLQNRVKYNRTESFDKGVGVDNDRDGRDYTVPGSEIEMMGGFSYETNNEPGNQLYWGTNLMKFYGSAIKPQGTYKTHLDGNATLDGKDKQEELGDNVFIYYATKPNGTDWTSDHELQSTYEYDLKFYKSLDEIPKGHICVGILTCFKGPGSLVSGTSPTYTVHHSAKVENDESLVGETYMLASSSRVWTKDMCEKANISLEQLPIDWTTQSSSGLFHGLPEDHLKSANFDPNNTNEYSWSTWYTKETYKPDGSGIYGTHNSDWSHWGDTLLIIGYKSGITKNLLQADKTTGQTKKVFDMDADQRVADFKLQPSTKFEQTGSFDTKTVVTVVDTLPKYMRYKPGSAYFGGSYEQTSDYGGTMGTITGGTLSEPDVVSNQDGTQTLKWTITDVEVGQPMDAIYYSVDIGTKGNPEEDVPSGAATELKNSVYITATGDMREPTLENGNYAVEGISVTRGSASSFGKYTKQKIVEADGEIDYVVYFNNNSSNAVSAAIMDTMPADKINRSKFNGTYEFVGWKLDVNKCNPANVAIYYTMDAQYKDKVIKDVGADEIKRSWTKANIAADGTIDLPPVSEGEEHPVAWAAVGWLEDGQSIYVDLKIQLYPEESDEASEETNYYVNTLSSGDTTTTTETPTVRRILEGLTWLDYNRDGLQNEEDSDRISGVKVELLRYKNDGSAQNESAYENVCYPGTDTPVVIETGQQISLRAKDASSITWYGTNTKVTDAPDQEPKAVQGRYKFMDLPAGIFAVRFSDGSGTYKISELRATRQDSGTTDADDAIDSDGMPVFEKESGALEKTIILHLSMPTVEDMSVSVFHSKNHDSGFYPGSMLKLKKTDETGTQTLSGAIFTIKDAKGNFVSFMADEAEKPGSYTVSEAEPGKASPMSGKYYIAYADNPYLVLGLSGTGNGSEAMLQSRIGSDTQLFELYDIGNGYQALKLADTGRWIDLDGGVAYDGGRIHLWDGSGNPTTNENQHWKIIKGQDGVCRISSRKDDTFCLDVSGAVGEANRVIHLWSNHDGVAQKWLLIPAANDEKAQTDLSVDAGGCLTIHDLMPGDYTIEEIKSPDGYTILSQPAEITVAKDGSVAMKTANGMVGVEGEGADQLLNIRNSEMYELPSAGGRGIYWYSIGGILLMMAGVLILYKNKCREVLGS